ncbi:WYL domain-containing protein [Variovorax sp. CY25R-8]|uniref:WYL domain-containing protein n=1 Tax=Variovorax sp. CY25R-8 TaxID=2855501 RepID=UPI0021BA6F7A|nr:WYL domain-containing protein [Variovorax sp. CY25R-8]MCT8178119.1 WYL domain-containing protein [Variovorax sp. CY25R-8]
MRTAWALTFLLVTVAGCTWGWRRTRAALSRRGWRSLPAHFLAAASGGVAAALALLTLAMGAAEGIALVDRLAFLFAVLVVLFAYWRVTAHEFPTSLKKAPAVPDEVAKRAAPPLPLAAAPQQKPKDRSAENTVAFAYRKSDGSEGRRTVRVERHGFEGHDEYVEGHCSEARASRTFRLDRIQGQVTIMATGELVSPAEMYRRLGRPARSLEVSSFVAEQEEAGRVRRPGWQTSIFFAGFGANQYAELAELAEAADMDVRVRISRTVDYVVTGNLAGRQQLAQAEAHGIAVIDEAAFRGMV